MQAANHDAREGVPMGRTTLRELRVGLVVLIGLAGLIGLLALAAAGPGFLGPRRTVEVVFRDGQGVRVGSPVRVAGIDAGRVQAVELFEAEDGVRVRVRLSLPASVADRLRQDVKIAVQAGLTGQSTVNIIGSGRSKVALVPGQVVQGIESSLFDPIIEQVGLGPAERNHIQQTIAQIRQTADEVAPRLRQTLAALAETTAEVRATVANVRPRVEGTAAEVEALVKEFDQEKLATLLQRLESLANRADATLAELGPVVTGAAENVRGLSGEVHDLIRTNRPQIEAMIAGLNATRTRLDAVLANAQVLTDQGASMLVSNRADIERSIANVRDATSFGVKLVQKLYGNPFYLSPFYKPRPEDIRAQEVYDSANAFLLGAKEFNDALKELNAMRAKAMTQRERDAYDRLFARAWEVAKQLQAMQQQIAAGLRENTPVRR
jgi:phospholipid/cholesterol/gamma-HCH transport system substrate-binding protein